VLGHSTYQKVTAALRVVAHGILAYLVDDHLAMDESQSIKCVKRFVQGLARLWYQEDLWYIMMVCMIIGSTHEVDEIYGGFNLMDQQVPPQRDRNRIERFLEVYHHIRDSDVHDELQNDHI
jgi:hypothetical protein